jgi:Fe-S oxidoreductase
MKGECIDCGLCKRNCPVFKVLLKETQSPRSRANFIKQEKLDPNIFYTCTLCEAYNKECPADVCLEVEEIRKKLVESGHETAANKKIIENLKKYGNPYGIGAEVVSEKKE